MSTEHSVNLARKDTNIYPPFCELCIVKFNSNLNASLHFNGPQHQNRIALVYFRSPNPNLIWCKTCCCELNTEKALELHEQSPKHLKKNQQYQEIMELKKEYFKAQEAKLEASNQKTETEETNETPEAK